MNKKRNGFTLVELLAIIVVLAVTALISTPIVINIINTAKKQSAVLSSNDYIKILKNQLVLKEESELLGIYTVDSLDVAYEGTGPTKGIIDIENGKIDSAKLCINNYSIYYDGRNSKISDINFCNDTKLNIIDNGNKNVIPLTDKLTYNYELSDNITTNYKNISCNNDAIPSLNGNVLTVDNVYGDTNCYLNKSLKNAVLESDNTLNNIILINDEMNISSTSTVEKGRNINLNLNGKKLVGKYIIIYIRDGSLVINGDGVLWSNVTDNANGVIKKWNKDGSSLIVNGNRCNSTNLDEYDSGTLIYGDTHSIAEAGFDIDSNNYSHLELNNGCYVSDTGSAVSSTERNDNKTIINNAYVYSNNGAAVYNWEGNTYINDGKYVSNNYGTLVNDSNGKMYINGGECDSYAVNDSVLLNGKNGIMNVNNATVISHYQENGTWRQIGIRNEVGTINISNTTVTSPSLAIYNNVGGTINVKSGIFENENTHQFSHTVGNNTNGYINICGGQFNGQIDMNQHDKKATGYIKYKSSGIKWKNGNNPTVSQFYDQYYIVDDTITCD